MWDTFILNPLINALLFLYQLFGGSFGLAIIVFTIVIRLATYPLTASSQKSMKKMQELQGSKEWQDLQKKYAKDKEKLQKEQMKLLQSAGANPVGGCLPILIQLPVLIGLYQSIQNVIPSTPLQLFSLSQRMYDFFPVALIPLKKTFLWLNLAQPEHLVLPGIPFPIPVLAGLVLVTSWVSQRIVPVMNTEAQGGQTSLLMNVFMVIFITQISLTLASGLSLYFIVSNLITIIQYMLMGKVAWKQVFSFRSSAPSPKSAK
ncbi:MAG: YidC/Oxa1 family membrane protein insertase [Anaerolineales bacterium]|nr:YidC/Oxa1 family membrane protein insertase [Anaerolineales bacterium]